MPNDMGDQQDAGERNTLLEQNAILRHANENLLLATFGAEDLRTQAEAANRRQNEFLAMLAHELRNPLAPISMASAMLARFPDPSPQLLHVKAIIDRQVSQLAHLLDDLLDAARISSGKIVLHCQPLRLADQLHHALEIIQARVSDRRQHLSLELPHEEVWISGDSVRLAQVLSNLLVNASKFTQDGGHIGLHAEVDGDEVVISVADDGAGIAADVLPGIFVLFAQGPRTLARSEGGLGVGLNVVRNVIEMHGGTVSATSAGLGHGATFTLRLPRLPMAAAPDTIPAASPPPKQPRHILLVEDNADASEMLQMVLSSQEHTVVAAFDGIAGLALACAGSFDVVLCDVGLPGISGYELVRTLRTTIGDAMPFCVAISGYGQLEDRTRAMAAGFDRHMVKPVDIDKLLALIASVPRQSDGH